MKCLVVAVCLLIADGAAAQPQTAVDIAAFMRTAKVVRAKEMSTGVTRPLRLTLTDGATTHDAVFQAVDEKKSVFVAARGPSEINFVDSWRYNIAAYGLAEAIGLDWMMPVMIEYEYRGRTGSLAWWMDTLMDERRRLKEKTPPRDVLTWNRDMYRMRIFSQLVRDTDRNLTNVLISPQWRVIMIDFTRAFRLHPIIDAREITQCDRQLFSRLEALTPEALKAAVGEYLTRGETEAVMKRRDLLVAHVRALVAERGEDKVLY